jgi:hypothetical protein
MNEGKKTNPCVGLTPGNNHDHDDHDDDDDGGNQGAHTHRTPRKYTRREILGHISYQSIHLVM